MRIILIDRDSALDGIGSRVLSGRLGEARKAAALRALRDLNPQVDWDRVPAGTVLLVPESRDFLVAESDPLTGHTLEELQRVVKEGMAAIVAGISSGEDPSAAERAELATVLKSAAVRRALADQPDLIAQLGQVPARLKEEARQSALAHRALDEATAAAAREIETLRDLMR